MWLRHELTKDKIKNYKNSIKHDIKKIYTIIGKSSAKVLQIQLTLLTLRHLINQYISWYFCKYEKTLKQMRHVGTLSWLFLPTVCLSLLTPQPAYNWLWQKFNLIKLPLFLSGLKHENKIRVYHFIYTLHFRIFCPMPDCDVSGKCSAYRYLQQHIFC